ncbi:MAG: hypothetical protein K2G31_05290, partial [Clostridia bacterium]|nr:hypothetical protein [Clostridia bacterium]
MAFYGDPDYNPANRDVCGDPDYNPANRDICGDPRIYPTKQGRFAGTPAKEKSVEFVGNSTLFLLFDCMYYST